MENKYTKELVILIWKKECKNITSEAEIERDINFTRLKVSDLISLQISYEEESNKYYVSIVFNDEFEYESYILEKQEYSNLLDLLNEQIFLVREKQHKLMIKEGEKELSSLIKFLK